jgi:hypothetical protein
MTQLRVTQHVHTPDGRGTVYRPCGAFGEDENAVVVEMKDNSSRAKFAPENVTPVTPPNEVGGVGLVRGPSGQPSHSARVATVRLGGGWKAIVGYGWAGYAVITPEGHTHTFVGWRNQSDDSESHITALEAVSVATHSGAPKVQGAVDESPKDRGLVIRQQASEVGDVVPNTLISSTKPKHSE